MQMIFFSVVINHTSFLSAQITFMVTAEAFAISSGLTSTFSISPGFILISFFENISFSSARTLTNSAVVSQKRTPDLFPAHHTDVHADTAGTPQVRVPEKRPSPRPESGRRWRRSPPQVCSRYRMPLQDLLLNIRVTYHQTCQMQGALPFFPPVRIRKFRFFHQTNLAK